MDWLFDHAPAKVPIPLKALAALVLGAFLGLMLLAAAGVLPTAGPWELLARVGSLLLPVSGLALLVAISLYDPLVAMLGWLALAPVSRHIPLDISLGAGIPDLSLTRLMAAWLLLLVLAQATLGRRRLRPLSWSDLVFALFCGAMLLTVSRSGWGVSLALQAIFDAYMVPFVGLYLARELVRDPRDLRRVMAMLLVIGVGLAFLVIREQLTGQVLLYSTTRPAAYSASIRKVQSLMGNAAPMGVTTALTLPLGLVSLVKAWRERALAGLRSKLLFLLLAMATGFIALGVFMTYNRASWLGAVLAVLVPGILRPAARRLLLPVLLVGAVLLAIFWQGVVNSPAVTERLLEDNSISYRTTSANLALDMARGSPLLGLGYGNFGFVASQIYGWDPFQTFDALAPSHNSYLFILVSGGLVALLPYLAWFGLVAWTGLRRYRHAAASDRDILAAGAALFLSYVLAAGTFDNAQTNYMNLVFFMTLGAIWGALMTVHQSPVPAH